MSLQSVLARVSEIHGAMAPIAPVQTATPAPPATSGGSSFASQLQDAVSGSSPAAAAPAASPASPGSYPHLTGDLDAQPELLGKLEALAASKGMKMHVTSGTRTLAEQQRLWDNRHNNPLPVAPPGKSRHQSGHACDVSIGGRPIQSVISDAELRAAGLVPLKGDAPHVELP